MPISPDHTTEARLVPLDPEEEQTVLRRWRDQVSGMDGERGGLPENPDDPVAYRLLDAAGFAIGRGEVGKGLSILRLVVKDYRHSQEAAFARQVIDRVMEQGGRERHAYR